ncbi:uncharacterized protein [Arachis hypogaea]|uniref:uncharacterized protein n=1 Tax=Arachis hypogaea TaxID=3818 RepID=UPI003B20EC30
MHSVLVLVRLGPVWVNRWCAKTSLFESGIPYREDEVPRRRRNRRLPPQSQPQRRKKRKHKSAHPESVTFDSVNGSNHDFEVNTSQLLAEVTTDEMPTTSATEQSTATAASGHGFSYGELRYRILNGGATCAVSALDDGNAKELSSVTSAEVENSQKELVLSGGGNVARSDTVELNRVLLVHGSDSDKSPVNILPGGTVQWKFFEGHNYSWRRKGKRKSL